MVTQPIHIRQYEDQKKDSLLHARLPKGLRKKLQSTAKRRGTTESKLVRQILHETMEKAMATEEKAA